MSNKKVNFIKLRSIIRESVRDVMKEYISGKAELIIETFAVKRKEMFNKYVKTNNITNLNAFKFVGTYVQHTDEGLDTYEKLLRDYPSYVTICDEVTDKKLDTFNYTLIFKLSE